MSVMNMPLPVKDEVLNFHDTDYNSDNIQQEENRLNQLYNQIEQLGLANAKLLRANRVLKLDCDKIVEEKTMELKQQLKLSIEQNIRLQRSNRLLQDEYQQQLNELNNIKREQIRKMKHVGPEYEYLVQVINLLYRQLAGKSNCEETCCYTSEKHTDKDNKNTSCRPMIRNHHIPLELEYENNELKHSVNSLNKLLTDKEIDNQSLIHELQLKDDIVKQLTTDFKQMEIQVNHLQKDYFHNTSSADTLSFTSELHSFPSVPINKFVRSDP